MYNDSYSERSTAERKHRRKILSMGIGGGVLCLLVLFLVLFGHTTVPAGYVGVRYRFGEVKETGIMPGWRWHAPFIDRVEKVITQEQVYESLLTAYTKDTQTVEGIESAVNWSYDTSKLEYIIDNVGLANVESKLLTPQVNSIMKNEVGHYKAEELVQNRGGLQEAVEQQLRESLAPYGINIHALNIKNIDFEDSFEEAVRAKVIAEQKAQETKNKTATIEEESRQAVIKAQAEADAAKVSAEAEAYAIQVIQEQLAQSPNYVELQKVQKWNGVFPEVMGNTVNPFVTIGGETSAVGNGS